MPEISTSAKADDDDDDDDLSDIDSIVSDITVGVVDEAIEEADLAAKSEAAAIPANDDEENDFEKDPWNAIWYFKKEAGLNNFHLTPQKWINTSYWYSISTWKVWSASKLANFCATPF